MSARPRWAYNRSVSLVYWGMTFSVSRGPLRAVLVSAVVFVGIVVFGLVAFVSPRPQDVAYDFGLANGFTSMCVESRTDNSARVVYTTEDGGRVGYEISTETNRELLGVTDLQLGAATPVDGLVCGDGDVEVPISRSAISAPDLLP